MWLSQYMARQMLGLANFSSHICRSQPLNFGLLFTFLIVKVSAFQMGKRDAATTSVACEFRSLRCTNVS